MPTQTASNIVQNATVTGTTETAAATSPFITDAVPHPGGLLVTGTVNITPGTGQTSVTLTIRQGAGTGGTVIQAGQAIAVTAGNPSDLPIYVIDGSPVAGGQYTVTVTQAGGAGNGTVNSALITVDEVLASG